MCASFNKFNINILYVSSLIFKFRFTCFDYYSRIKNVSTCNMFILHESGSMYIFFIQIFKLSFRRLRKVKMCIAVY